MFTNVAGHGGEFLNIIDEKFETSTDVSIASGYTSYDILSRYRDKFIAIATNGGSSKLLLGMAFYEGLSANKLSLLNDLSEELESINEFSGVYVTYGRRYHGKIYKFSNSGNDEYYLGSSNFSRSGLSQNIEAMAIISNPDTVEQLDTFLSFLLSEDNSVSIRRADITVPGTTRYRNRIALDTLDDLARYDPSTIDTDLYQSFDYSLSRIVEKERSNLNCYFGRGRLNRTTGFVKPRPWYEVELISNVAIIRNPHYPTGDFQAYTDDGYIIPMYVGGDNNKNMRSRGRLSILGQWIKGKLQRNGALLPLTPVNQDTLDTYGNDTIKFYKIDENRYFIEF
jgi:hypothetical protein